MQERSKADITVEDCKKYMFYEKNEKTVDRKEKISRKITTVFHSKEINMKNVIYYSVNNKRIFMK